MRRPNLSGAFGVPSPPPALGAFAHPDRVIRFLNFQRVAWAIRLGAIATVLALLYTSHLLRV